MPTGLILPSPINWESPINRGLTSWWLCTPANAGGPWLFDSSPGYHHIGVTGPAPNFRVGADKRGSTGRTFPSSSSSCFVSESDEFQRNTTFTVSAAIRPDRKDGNWGHFVGHQATNTNRHFSLTINGGYLGTANVISAFWYNGGDQAINSSYQITQGQDYYVTFVAAPANLKLYVNGVLEYSSSGTVTTPGSAKFSIGNLTSSGTPASNEGFTGLISSVRFFQDRAITNAEVVQEYQDWLAGWPTLVNRRNTSRMVVLSDSGGGSDGVGSASFAFAASGVGSSIASAAGSSTITFSASATGQAISSAAGSSSIAFAASGTGQAISSGVGSSSFQFDAAGVGSSSSAGQGVGSASFSFDATATASATASAVGAASFLFTANGSSEATIAATGSASFAFNASGYSPSGIEPDSRSVTGRPNYRQSSAGSKLGRQSITGRPPA